MFAVALRGTFALRRTQFASSRQCNGSDAETDSVAEGAVERRRERENMVQKGPKPNTIRVRWPSAKLEKELDANKHAGADSCSIGLRFDLDT